MINSILAEYMEKFGYSDPKEYAKLQYPANKRLIPYIETAPGPGPYTEEQAEKIYQQCIDDGKPWQEYPEIVKAVKSWYRQYKRGMQKGEVY